MFLSIGDISDIESENEIRLRGLRTFIDNLKKNNVGLHILGDMNAETLAETKILWVLWPDRWFDPPEIEAISTSIKNGMGLLVTSEWAGIEHNAEILNTLVSDLGIKFNKDRIIDPINAYTQSELSGKPSEGHSLGGKVVEFIKVKDFAKHPIVEGIGELAYYSGCSLTVGPENMLAKSKFVSFSDVDGDKKWSEGEKIGSAVAAAYAQVGKGRVIAVGDTSLFTDKYLKFGDNDQFFKNVLKWLLKEI